MSNKRKRKNQKKLQKHPWLMRKLLAGVELVQSCVQKKENIIMISIMIVFGVIYSLISLENHYQFRTYALDLGMFNNAIYSFSHFRLNYFPLAVDGTSINYFADHFSLITVLYAPFYYLLRSYTLLIIQIAAILFGGLGVYLVAKERLGSKYLPLVILLQFFGLWGIYSALAFDFHNNVVAAMMVPWLFYLHLKEKRKLFLLVFVVIIIAKENMALWMVFILIGLMLQGGRSAWKIYLRFEIPLTIVAALYFVLVVSVVMPALGNGGTISQFQRYDQLGDSPSAIIGSLITHPSQVISMMFTTPPTTNKDHVDDKTNLHLMVLGSGGPALLTAPSYIVMLIPIYLQKLLTNDYSLWGISGQYSIEFAPIIALALTAFLVKLKRRKIQYPVAALFAVTTFVSLFIAASGYSMTPFNNSDNVTVFSSSHYSSKLDGIELNIPQIESALDMIPPDAPISVSSSLAPHMSFRDKIYLYPVIKDASYIILLRDNQDNFIDPAQLREGKGFTLVANWRRLHIFKRT